MNFEDCKPSGWLKTTSARSPEDCDRTFITGTFAVSMISSQLICPFDSMWSASIFIAEPDLQGISDTATSTSPLGSERPVKNEPKTETLQAGHKATQASLMLCTHFLRAWISSLVCCIKSTKSKISSCKRRTVFSMWGRATNHGGCPSSTTLFRELADFFTAIKASGASAAVVSLVSSLRRFNMDLIEAFRSACSAFLSESSSWIATSSSRSHPVVNSKSPIAERTGDKSTDRAFGTTPCALP